MRADLRLEQRRPAQPQRGEEPAQAHHREKIARVGSCSFFGPFVLGDVIESPERGISSGRMKPAFLLQDQVGLKCDRWSRLMWKFRCAGTNPEGLAVDGP